MTDDELIDRIRNANTKDLRALTADRVADRIAELTDQVGQLTADLEAETQNHRVVEAGLTAVIDRVRALHQKWEHKNGGLCHHCDDYWPCDTIRILDDTKGDR